MTDEISHDNDDDDLSDLGSWDGADFVFREMIMHKTLDRDGISFVPVSRIKFGSSLDGIPRHVITQTVRAFADPEEASFPHVCDDSDCTCETI